jgi:hypothetical protein
VFGKLLSRAFQQYIFFEFGEKLYELYLNEGFKSAYFNIITHFKWRSMFLHWIPRKNINTTSSSFNTLIETSEDFLGFKSINTECFYSMIWKHPIEAFRQKNCIL